jgi:hypothetical protein
MSDKIRMSLVQGMGEYARQNRLNRLRKKYSGAPEAMQEAMGDVDEAGELAKMPEAKKMPASAAVVIEGMKDVNEGAEKENHDYKNALGLSDDDDEEMQKWMAKQRG